MSKGKGTRSSTATSSTPAPVAPVSNDILPGRFTEADWLGVVELEDGEELVGDLIEEMVSGVMKVIHEKHIDEQCIPHSLAWTQNIIEKLVEWQFLAYDPGEGISTEWEEDAEPDRTPLDSWGRGSVPCRLVKVKEIEIELGEEGEDQEDEDHLPDNVENNAEQEEDHSLSVFDPLTEKPNITKLNKIRDSIKQYNISNDVVACLRSVEEPPALQNYLYQAVMLTLTQDHTTYKYDTFLEELEKTIYQINTSTAEILPRPCTEQLKTFAENVQLHPDHVSGTLGGAAAKLATWVQLVYCYQLTCDEIQSEFDAKMIKYVLIEMKSLSAPPSVVKDVMTVVASLIQCELVTKYEQCKKVFAYVDLVNRMENIKLEDIPEGLIKKLKRRFMVYTSDDVASKSAAASLLYQWCEAVIYGGGVTFSRPSPKRTTKPKKRVKKIQQPEVVQIVPDHDFTLTEASPDNMMPHQSAAMVKAQHGRPPGLKEVEYDERGNVVSVLKINKLPSHRVSPKFEIMDPVAAKQPFRSRKLKPLKAIPQISTRSGTIEPAASVDHTPVPPSFVDSMTVAPGVVVKQGSRVKRGAEGAVILSPIDPHRTPQHQQQRMVK